MQCSLEFLTPTVPGYLHIHSSQLPDAPPLSNVSPAWVDVGLVATPLDLVNMELLHHYTSSTCLDLGTLRNTQVWQVEIPRLALSHAFVMHGILAISAVHLATLQRQRRTELAQRAAMAEHMALTSLNELVSASQGKDIHSVFAFAGFLPPYLLAQSQWLDVPKGRIPSQNDGRPHWFLMLRGLVGLLSRNWADLTKGPFRPLLIRTATPIDRSRNPDDDHLSAIYPLLQAKVSASSEVKDILNTCRVALDELRRVAALPYSPCKTLGHTAVLWIWPGAVSDCFVQLIYERRPEALVILAHYCVLLKKLNSCWYLEGVGDAMLSTIEKLLGAKWKPHITWALKQPNY